MDPEPAEEELAAQIERAQVGEIASRKGLTVPKNQ